MGRFKSSILELKKGSKIDINIFLSYDILVVRVVLSQKLNLLSGILKYIE